MKPHLDIFASNLKVGQSLVMWSPTISLFGENLAPITSVRVSAKTTRIIIEQGPLRVEGSIRFYNEERVQVVE